MKELNASVADPADAGAYPITTYSGVLLCSQYADRAKGARYAIFAGDPVPVTDHGCLAQWLATWLKNAKQHVQGQPQSLYLFINLE